MKPNSKNYSRSTTRAFAPSLPLCLTLALGATMLSGCSTVRVKPDDLPPIPANLLTPCPPLDPLTDGKPESVAKQMLQDSRAYLECKDKHRLLTETIKFRESILTKD